MNFYAVQSVIVKADGLPNNLPRYGIQDCFFVITLLFRLWPRLR